ncbi:hypothetical protein WICANDRAFT_80927 [Wickerhamomyces anomalus NRRL Y-366-8]|uniref:Uncharacterized protein n=1 Tax=Wickerhamomyces anomalus (strain ATCC 58044 / CBS 1984 / NCYC 433 / NRRL Y-366-8) TaxID=683960 RepID=A0A1E3NWT4_WICAA|nr:uncharacterized protein WICANDRAFT_80927 [Wickerhamomyces anomalus NRRL Y-366-8]ODQ57596.1 hypothetical protein WICANDRAFT_80927 [Wickerhamomyces anomalus NRRL Y-366-8]
MSLESQASERKNRLAALRNKRKPNTLEVSDEQATKKPTPEHTIISRNYNPETQEPILGFNKPPTTLDENAETVEAVSQKIQDEVLSKFAKTADLGFTNNDQIRTKTVTSDLMRDLQPKLDILQERTDEAINKIVKEKVQKLRERNS